MRLRGLLPFLTAVLVVGGASTGARAENKRVAVPEMHMTGADAGMGRTLTEILTAETARVESLTLISSSDIAAMLGFEKQKELLGCADNVACMAEIGGALGVDYLLVAEVGLVGKTYVLNAKLIDAVRIQVVSRIYRTVAGEPDALIGAVRACVPEILKPIASAAELAVLSPAAGATSEAVASPTGAETSAAALQPAARPPRSEPAPERKVDLTPPASATRTVGHSPTRWPGWTLVAVGAVGLLVSGAMELDAKSKFDDAERSWNLGGVDIQSSDSMWQYEDATSASRKGLVFGAVGGALAVGGVVWLMVARQPAPVALSVRVDGEQTGATVLARF